MPRLDFVTSIHGGALSSKILQGLGVLTCCIDVTNVMEVPRHLLHLYIHMEAPR